jgi:NitT/TauT family transport system substrate-binding protein
MKKANETIKAINVGRRGADSVPGVKRTSLSSARGCTFKYAFSAYLAGGSELLHVIPDLTLGRCGRTTAPLKEEVAVVKLRSVIALMLTWTLLIVPAAARAADVLLIHEAINSLTAVQWPDFISRAQGFNEQQGLNVDIVLTQPESMISALLGGSTEIALPNATGLALSVDKGANIVAVGIGADNIPYHFVTSPAVKTFKDLKGKTIALADPTDIYTTVMRTILKKHGLNPDSDVSLLYGPGQNQRYAAILAGAIQGGFFALPADADLASRGYNSLAFTPDYFPNLTLSVIAVNRAWAEQHPDVLRKFLRARSDAIKWLNNPANKDRAIAILMTETKLPIGPATASYDYYVAKAHLFPADGCVQRKGLDTLVRMLRDEKRVTGAASDAGKLMDRQWCPR